MIDQPTETQNRGNPATQSHGSKVMFIFVTRTARLPNCKLFPVKQVHLVTLLKKVEDP
jgi:hypothetical protein